MIPTASGGFFRFDPSVNPSLPPHPGVTSSKPSTGPMMSASASAASTRTSSPTNSPQQPRVLDVKIVKVPTPQEKAKVLVDLQVNPSEKEPNNLPPKANIDGRIIKESQRTIKIYNELTGKPKSITYFGKTGQKTLWEVFDENGNEEVIFTYRDGIRHMQVMDAGKWVDKNTRNAPIQPSIYCSKSTIPRPIQCPAI